MGRQTGEIFGLGLQARIELGRGARTIVDILSERMDGVDRAVRRPSLKERLGLKGLGCCGPTWGLGPTTMSVRDDDGQQLVDDEDGHGPPLIHEVIDAAHNPIQDGPIFPPCVLYSPAPTGMNLAAALAAERQMRAALDSENGGAGAVLSPAAPSRVSLMRLLEETECCDNGEMMKRGVGEEWGGCDSVCCVCMGRKKGAAFIPCGHTFCRVCSREVWLNRGSCPLCNRSILEILDIY